MQTPTPVDPTFPGDGDGFSRPTSRATEIGRKAASAIDDKKEALASGLASAASLLHERADDLPGGEKVARAARSTAEAMERAAVYVRDQDLRGALSDVQQVAKRNPGVTLLAAVAVGFLLARSLSKH